MSNPKMTNSCEGPIVEGLICPRCRYEEVTVMVQSPVGNVWEIYLCGLCMFSWRSTEIEEIRDPEQYDPQFRLTREEVEDLMVIPAVPELLHGS